MSVDEPSKSESNNEKAASEKVSSELNNHDQNTSSNAASEPANESEKWKNDFLYLKAEFENYKRHMIRERSDLVKYGSERLILSLLEVLDVFDRALEMNVSPETLDAFVTGVKLTSDELRTTLGRFGVTGQDPLGEPFDPSQHEALSSEETTEVPPGHISRVFRRAYKLHDRTIRPAQVVVAKEPPKDIENNDR